MNKCNAKINRLAAFIPFFGHPLVFEFLFEATVPF